MPEPSDLVPVKETRLTPAQYGALADVPPELEWLANVTNPQNPPRLPDRRERVFGLHGPAQSR